MSQQLIWSPPKEHTTRLTRFRRSIAARHNVDLPTYAHFWQWSVDHPDRFWEAIWDECDIIGDRGPNFCAGVKSGDDLYPPPQWFEGTKLNYAENLLRWCDQDEGKPAVIGAFEPLARADAPDAIELDFPHKVVTRGELRRQVAAAAAAFRSQGVARGDVIGAYAANNIESFVASLACSAIGAIWCSVAAEAAPEAVLDRFETVRPKWVISVQSVRYNGKRWGHLDKLRQVISALDASRKSHEGRLEGVIVASGPEEQQDNVSPQVAALASPTLKSFEWDDFIETGAHARDKPIAYERLGFNAPLWILFSSGTTGKPKAITHRAGGMLLQLAKEHLLHSGLNETDVVFQFSTLSWMMSPWGNATIMSGATMVLYDGSPLKPTPYVLFSLAAQFGVTVFGTSAAFLDILSKRSVSPRSRYEGHLKIKQVLSTGSPLRADLYPWIKEHIGDVLVGSITGGTDICSLFAGNNVDLPVYAGEIQAPNLGMHVGVISTSTGKALPYPPLETGGSGVSHVEGEEGELVCLTPFPAQPLSFWNQPEEKYRSSYFEALGPKVWSHGDWVSWTKHGGLVMKGRSDGVLNPGGVRFGSAEIYEVLSALSASPTSGANGPDFSAITASLCISLRTPDKSDEVVVLCLVVPLSQGSTEWTQLVDGIKVAIRSRRSARHVPRFVVKVDDVPVTVNGKLAEVPAKKLLNGAPMSSINASTLANAGCLEAYEKLGEDLRAQL
ncbi:unnamed protein product [Parajaminaea phylloscopi]